MALYRVTALILLLLSPPLRAGVLNWEIGGAAKTIGSYVQLQQQGIYSETKIPSFEERLRLQAALFDRHFRLEVADEISAFWEKPNRSVVPVPDFNPLSAWEATWDLKKGPETRAYNKIDRAFLQITSGELQTIIGKQVVATGVGQLFSAVSQTQRYPLVVIDPEFPKTEDAVSMIWMGPLRMEARYLPKTKGQQEDSFHLRSKGSKDGFDVAMTGGKSDGKAFVGLEATGNVGDSVIRAEVIGYQYSKGVVQALLGWDYVFSQRWSGQVELFYNGFGVERGYRFENFPHRSAPYRGKVYGGFHLTWETTSLLKTHLLLITNINDPSCLAHLYANYSLGNSVDILLGQYLGFGRSTTEFGGRLPVAPGMSLGYPNITYIALRGYF